MIVRIECIAGASKGSCWEHRGSSIGIGRGHDNEVCLDPEEAGVSRLHCRVAKRGRAWVLRDLGSKNGTRVNGRPVHDEVEVRSGDTLLLGRAKDPALRVVFSEDGEVRVRRRRRLVLAGVTALLALLALPVVVVVVVTRLFPDEELPGPSPIPASSAEASPAPALEGPAPVAEADLEDAPEIPLSQLPPLEDWLLGRWTLARQEGARVLGLAPHEERLCISVEREDGSPDVFLGRAIEIGPEQRRFGDLDGREGDVILRFRFLAEASQRGGTAYFRVSRLASGRGGSPDRFVSRNDYAWVDLRRGQLLGNAGAWLREDER